MAIHRYHACTTYDRYWIKHCTMQIKRLQISLPLPKWPCHMPVKLRNIKFKYGRKRVPLGGATLHFWTENIDHVKVMLMFVY